MNKEIITIIIVVIILIIFYIIYSYIRDNIDTNNHKINEFLTNHCQDPAVFNTNEFEWTKKFRNNWKSIRNEYFEYTNKYSVPNYKDINAITASCDVNNGWKSLFLRIFGVDTDAAKLFPKTMKLINSCPCTLAFFSVFEPGTKLKPHVGVYKGVIRYHLPIIIPDDWHKCFINVNGQVLNWKEGEDLMFDDMFLHYAENNTKQQRVVLFLDIKRDFKNFFINIFNTLILGCIKSNDILQDTVSKANSSNKNSIESANKQILHDNQ